MNKREIAIILMNQNALEYEFQFRLNGNWHNISYSHETGFKGDYPNEIVSNINCTILDCSNDRIRNINIK